MVAERAGITLFLDIHLEHPFVIFMTCFCGGKVLLPPISASSGLPHRSAVFKEVEVPAPELLWFQARIPRVCLRFLVVLQYL